ncbi:extracellular solute-binding protein [Paenibacillus daejeonensis]|uniref:extracellular solute-binding protein n=1 Tax=Paenibacillus daejeonensis TaxID=135193 RepID=UPI0003602308|nr:extracellular solute-binding protein [Paenibacillus daejeonensis]
MHKAKGKALKVGMLVLASSLVLGACSGGNGSGSSSGSEDGPVDISIMSVFFTPSPPPSNNEVQQKIEEVTNAKLDIQWVSANNYPDRLNVTLASGDLPDIVYIGDPFSSTFRTAVNQGAFWDLSPFLEDYPNLMGTLTDTAWELTRINDGNYGIPRPRPAEADTFFTVRADWLENLGLDMPTTPDELYDVMKAFKEQDPDGNGQQDTIAYAGYVNPENMGSMGLFEQIFLQTTGQSSGSVLWKDVDGELVFAALLPEMREALEYMARGYQEGLFPPDLASLKVSQVRELFQSGRAGLIAEKSGAYETYIQPMKQIWPEMEMTDLVPITQINDHNPAGPGFSGINAIPRSVPEEKVRQILAVYDTWVTDEVFELHRQGVEGVHHTVENGEVVLDTAKIQSDAIESYNQIVYVADPYDSTSKPWFPQEAQDLYRGIQDEKEQTSSVDVSIGVYSETAQTYQPELLKELQDMKTKIILGSEPITAWDAYVERLQANANFVKMAEEMNADYQSRKSQ